MLKLENDSDLQRLVTEQIQESEALDYKASPALGKSDNQRKELCKDVTAFANSAGGQIVYGIVEEGGLPTKVDDGADATITKEWIEQVIDSRVQPRIEGLVITPIQLAKGLGFVITVPQATSRAPHQAPDKKYYKRQNFQSIAMEDYEIRDVLRRATTPDLFVTLTLVSGDTKVVEYGPNTEISKPIHLRALISNRSPQPAFHTVILIGLDAALDILPTEGAFARVARPSNEHGPEMNWVCRRFSSPPEQPIFQEADPLALSLAFRVRSDHLHSTLFRLTTIIQTPGFSATEHWSMVCKQATLTLNKPTHPLS